MPRLARFAAMSALAVLGLALAQAPAHAGGADPTRFMTWPGKAATTAQRTTPASAVALPRQFFSSGGDMAAPPPPLPPRTVAGTQAATASDNTASNRARQNELLTADSAADGPTGGAGNPD